MSMSKKDFIAIADAIREHNRIATNLRNVGIETTRFDSDQLSTLADALQRTNSVFMRDRWLDYIAGKVGPSGGAVKRA